MGRYRIATRDFVNAASELRQIAGELKTAEFHALLENSRQARSACHEVRAILEHHRAIHDCQGFSTSDSQQAE
jgi:hypothetical protein